MRMTQSMNHAHDEESSRSLVAALAFEPPEALDKGKRHS